MNSPSLRRTLVLYTFIPLLLLSIISGVYLYQVVLSDKLSHIDDINSLYDEFLQEKANHALATGDYPYFQRTIDGLINKENTNILSIELVDSDKKIVASTPESPPVHKKAVRLDIYNHASNDEFLNLDLDAVQNTGSEQRMGYLVIRYNDMHISQAISQVTYQLLFLLTITITLTFIVYKMLHNRILVPHKNTIRNLEMISNDDIVDITAFNSNNYTDSLIVKLSKRFIRHTETVNSLNSKLRQSKNEINEARISQYEMINELVNGLERPISLSRRLLSSLLATAPDNGIKEDYYLLSGTIDDISNLITHSRAMVNNPYKNHTNEPIKISSFYKSISNSNIDSNYKLLSSKNIKDELLSSYILTDSLQLQLLVEKIIQMASKVCVGNEIYISMIIHELGLTDDRARIIIEIHDTSTGMPLDDARNINLFINNEKPLPTTNYFSLDDIKTIKHLKRLPNLMLSFSPETGRGNYYRISLECEISDNVESLTQDSQSPLTTVISIQEDQPGTLLTEHFRAFGIDIKYSLFSKFDTDIDMILNQDAIIIDLSTNYEQALSILENVNKHHENIIIVVNSAQGNDSLLLDKLYDKGAKDILRTKYSPESLNDSINKIIRKENSINKYLMSKFYEKNDDV